MRSYPSALQNLLKKPDTGHIRERHRTRQTPISCAGTRMRTELPSDSLCPATMRRQLQKDASPPDKRGGSSEYGTVCRHAHKRTRKTFRCNASGRYQAERERASRAHSYSRQTELTSTSGLKHTCREQAQRHRVAKETGIIMPVSQSASESLRLPDRVRPSLPDAGRYPGPSR